VQTERLGRAERTMVQTRGAACRGISQLPTSRVSSQHAGCVHGCGTSGTAASTTALWVVPCHLRSQPLHLHSDKLYRPRLVAYKQHRSSSSVSQWQAQHSRGQQTYKSTQ